MAVKRVHVVTCDRPNCLGLFTDTQHSNARDARYEAARYGWTTSGPRDAVQDWCPEHPFGD